MKAVLVSLLFLLAADSFAQKKPDPALELYFAANAAYNRKLYPIAAGNYQKFLATFSTHEKAQLARYGLGLSQFRLKQYDRAVGEFRRLLDERKLDAKIERGRLTLLHAQCLLYSGKADEAQQRLVAAASNLKPGVHRTGATAAVADLYFNKKDWAKAVEWARKVHGVAPTPAQTIRAGYQEGFAQYKLDKFAEAVAVLGKARTQAVAAKSMGWQTRIEFLLGECHMATGKLELAEAALKTALPELTGEAKADCLYRLGMVKFDLKKWEVSQADFQSFLNESKKPANEDPRRREAEFLVGRCLMEQKLTNKADQRFNALGNGNDHVAARAYLWRGRLYSREKKYDAAANALRPAVDKEWYKKGIPAKPGQPPAFWVADIDFEHANALMLQPNPNWMEAIKYLQRVQQRRGDYPQIDAVQSQLAICQHKLKQYNPSFQTTERFIRERPQSKLIGDVRFLHGENLFLLNRLDEAVKVYADFLNSEKDHGQRLAAEFRIAQVHHHKQQWAESNKRAVPLLARNPDGKLFQQLAFVVGENYFRLANWAEATDPLEAFLKVHFDQPKNPNQKPKLTKGPNLDAALVQLGVAYARQGQATNAVDRLKVLTDNYGSESPHLPLALSEQGKQLYDLGELKKARQSLERFVNERRNPNNKNFQAATAEVGRVHYYLGWIDSKEKRFKESAVNFGEAAKHSGSRKSKDGASLAADAALQQGIALVEANDLENAAKHLQHVGNQYREHPRRDLILYYTGLAFTRVKNWGTASGFFKQVVENYPKAPFADKATYEWAWCERSQKRNKEATERYELLLKQYPQSTLATKVQSELAELNLDAGAQDEVIAKLTATMKTVKEPELQFELEYQLASAHFKKGNEDGYLAAVKIFEELIPRGEKSKLLPSILFQAAESRLALQETQPAREHFLAGTRLSGVPPELAESNLLRLGETQNETGQFKEAQKSYEQFTRQYGQSQWIRNARYGLGYALEKQMNYAKAIGEYSKLLPQNNENPLKMDKWMVQARYQIGECYFNTQKYDQAMAEFLSVEVNAQGYPKWRAMAVLEMARIALAQNKKEEAEARLKEVIGRFKNEKVVVDAATKLLDELRLQK